MSLNGLDTPAVYDAYNTAIAEAGGWFLLRYTSRDSVELLGRGKGGVHEARQAIANYKESSPLYGLLIYRRRKVLIKYIPEGTSRVLQARTAVHFTDVIERYSPYETLLEITTADGLNDTSLAASFPLHTASLSASSSRLHEISEDAEDGNAPRRPTMQSLNNGSIFGTRQYKMEKRVDQIMRADRPTVSSIIPQSVPQTDPAPAASLPPNKTSIASQFLVREDSGKRSITSLSTPISEQVTDISNTKQEPSTGSEPAARSVESKSTLATDTSKSSSQQPTSPRYDGRSSTSTVSNHEPLLEDPSLASDRSPPVSHGTDSSSTHAERMKKLLEEPFDFSYLEAKQKVKLGPRPVTQSKRATTTAAVSALPAHYRPATAKKQEPQTPSFTSQLKPMPALPVPPIPNTPEYNPRPISRGSVKSMPSNKNTAMTPDKLRLMKAVELRKRQLRKSNPQLPTSVPGVDVDAPIVPRIPEQILEQPRQEEKLDGTRQSALIHEEAVTKKADSGIEMGYDKAEKSEKVDDAQDEPKPAQEEPETRQEPVHEEQEFQDSHEQTEEEIAAAEALRNDELKAEAEGYSAMPTEEEEQEQDKRPRLDGLAQAPQSPTSVKLETSPPSNYSDARTDRPVSALTATQDATNALSKSIQEEQSEHDAGESLQADQGAEQIPSIITSPSSPTAAHHAPFAPRAEPVNAEESEDDSQADTLDVDASPRRQNTDMAKRRRGIVEPLNLSTEAELLADEDLMDELSSATVHEAKPMAVARSPVAAYFPRRPSNQSLVSAQSQRSGNSTPRRHTPAASQEKLQQDPETLDSLTEPARESDRRSVSPMDRGDLFTGIRRNVSSGITKRFQALADNAQHSVPANTKPSSQEGSPSERRVRNSPRTRAGSFKGRWGLGDRTSTSSTTASIPEGQPVWTVSQDGSNRDSINVKARIVRPTSTLDSHAEQPDSNEIAKIQESQLEISHGSSAPAPAKLLPPLNTKSAPEPVDTVTTTSPVNTRRPRHQPIITPQTAQPEDFPVPPTTSRTLSATSEDTATISSNSGSRTSRFFKRMSSLGTNKRRSTAAQSVTSPINVESAASDRSMRTISTITEKDKDRGDMPPAAALGDLNVQFPDTLLWKRRWLTLDDAGNLNLGVPQAMAQNKITTGKKYHLSEFKLPYIPDVDRQEMPHSICLDFESDEGSLQVACEDAMSQRQVLSMMRTYWKSWVG